MKFNKKIAFVSAAVLLSTTPVLINQTQSNVVQAAPQTATGTIKITDSYSYASGKNPRNLKKGQSVKYYGAPKTDTKSNEGGNYFPILRFNIGNGNYLSVDSTKKISGPKWLTVVNNSYLYNKNGRKLSRISRWQNLAYSGKVKAATKQRFYFRQNGGKEEYIPYHNIKGVPYYNLGKGRYVKVADIGFVNTNPLIARKCPHLHFKL